MLSPTERAPESQTPSRPVPRPADRGAHFCPRPP